MKFFTLIHICRDEKSLHNNAFVSSFKDQINLYFSCAKQLHRSLKAEGIELVLITNNKEFLESLNGDKYAIEILQLDFNLNVPSGIKFYSAHYKIEILKYLSSLTDDYTALVDCDMLCINSIPESLKNIISRRIPLYYDITDQMTPAFGQQRIISDKQKLSGTKSSGLWAGGEFIAGPPEFFKKLFNEIQNIQSRYFSNFNSFHHQGDEMLTSVAIENLMVNSDIRIMDAGTLSIIGRFWSYKPLHVQKSIGAYSQHFLLHLPSDKKFISNLKPAEMKGDAFFKNYKQHLFISRAIETTFKGIKPYVKRVKEKLAN